MITYYEQASEQASWAYIFGYIRASPYSISRQRMEEWIAHPYDSCRNESWLACLRELCYCNAAVAALAVICVYKTIARSTVCFSFAANLQTKFKQTSTTESGSAQHTRREEKHGSNNSSVSFTLNVKRNGLREWFCLLLLLSIACTNSFHTQIRVRKMSAVPYAL